MVLYFIMLTLSITNHMTLYDFSTNSDLSNWTVVNDVVMGGRSEADFFVNSDGHAVFQGKVSLENNGGFSSVRYRFAQKKTEDYDTMVIRLKGDGKRYQFRVKTASSDRHSYIYHFQTTGDWQIIEIPFTEMYPGFRGNKLDMPNYPGKEMEEIAFLIANNKAEAFNLELDKIFMK